MQQILKQSGFIILSVLVLVIIKQTKQNMEIPVRLFIVVMLFSVFVGVVEGIIGEILSLLNVDGVNEYLNIMLKALFVGIVTSICSSICQDAGEGTLSYASILIGKAQILILSLPLIRRIVESAIGLIEGANL